MSVIFQFKKFEVNQRDCAMKINTDGVVLGAIADAALPKTILDIGTGTGVIALMLAQRFTDAQVDAVEIDQLAAGRARQNFIDSPFASRMRCFHQDFMAFKPSVFYDLITANPPYFLNSLKNTDSQKAVARHAGASFFDELLQKAAKWLTRIGALQLILPIDVADKVKSKLMLSPELTLLKETVISSFPDSDPVRIIMSIGKEKLTVQSQPAYLAIYQTRNKYSTAYKELLKDFFLAF